MSGFSGFLTHISPYIPYLIVIVLGLGLVLIITLSLLGTRAVKRAAEKKQEAKGESTAKKEQPHQARKKGWLHRLPPHIGMRLSTFLSGKGYVHVGNLGLSFLRAIELMRQRFGGRNYKYRLPWFLLIGAENSGKSSLMRCSEQVLPLGTPDFNIQDANPAVRWWFTAKSLVLDIKGSLLLSASGVEAGEDEWRNLTTLLARYRARRPLDGIILTIPATELYGPNKLQLDDVSERARYMAEKLATTQRHLGLQLPIYVVITKCDIIPGFQNFTQAIPFDNRHNILGWSNPYALHTAYTPAWIEDAFQHLETSLHQLRLEILATSDKPQFADGVFVFPAELQHLQLPLTPYLNNIFKLNSYEETGLFRGLYFVGDTQSHDPALFAAENQGAMLLDAETAAADESAEKKEEARYEAEHSRFVKLEIGEIDVEQGAQGLPHHIFFFNDLLAKKISAETGLSRPLQTRLHRANRHLMVAKISTATLTVLGVVGMMHAYDRLKKNHDLLLPVLGKMAATLRDIPRTPLTHLPHEVAEQHTRHLLETMRSLKYANFFSVYLPASWVSSLPKKLRKSLKIAYKHIILRTIYMDLVGKARDLSMRPAPDSRLSPSLGVQLTPVETPEYQAIRQFMADYVALTQHIDKYNRLKEVNDATLLQDLIRYTLDMDLPKDFFENYQGFHAILQTLPYPQIDLTLYARPLQETASRIYLHFIYTLLSPEFSTSIIGKIQGILQHNHPDSDVAVQWLRQTAMDLDQNIPMLGQAGQTWIDADFFNPHPDFETTMGEIGRLFGPTFMGYLASETDKIFKSFQYEMKRLNALLVAQTFMPLDKESISSGIFKVHQALSTVFHQSFMSETTPERFNPVLPDNQEVMWNSALIETAINISADYENFMTKDSRNLPVGLRDSIKSLAHQNLGALVINLLGRAQNYTPVSGRYYTGYGAEENLLDKIKDIRAITPKMLKLLYILEQAQIGDAFVELRAILGASYSRLLGNIQTLLESYSLYRIKNDHFEWWDGYTSPILDGFGVKDTSELREYLRHQKDLVHRLVTEFAEPIIDFLSSPIMRGYEGNEALLISWKSILKNSKSAEKNKAESTLYQLEAFLEDHVCMACPMLLSSEEEVGGSSADLFTKIRLSLKKKLTARCEVLARRQSIENYKKLAQFFNATLKGKFPFVDPALTINRLDDADPEIIREFLKMYDNLGGDPKKILDQVYQLGGSTKGMMDFLASINTVKDFFDTYMGMGETNLPALDFAIDFRANREQEVLGNKIIEWSLTLDETTTITNHNKKRVGRWEYGMPMTFSFRWPQSSEIKPLLDRSQSIMQISEDNHIISFVIPSKWSLLWAIWKLGRDQSRGSPYTLVFEVPNGPSRKTVVFNTLTLFAPKGKKSQAVSLPDFPEKAPDVPSAIINIMDKPVLTEKIINARIDPSATGRSQRMSCGANGGGGPACSGLDKKKTDEDSEEEDNA